MALTRPRFPILAFDEWELSLSRGSAFNQKWLMPGESLISILWKFACANVLPGDALMHLISPLVDPSMGVAPVRDNIELARLCRVLRLPEGVLRMSLLDAALAVPTHPAFRYCRLCAAHGYHSVLYQLEEEERCPVHHQSLDTRCLHCSCETPHILSASVIEAPFRCLGCRSHVSYGRLSLRSTIPAMSRQDRMALSRHWLLRSGNDMNGGSGSA
ncbi:hypothetical protein [Paraburkholderia largidicola]|uniref:TniQ family protein n=1 Tax=Paraburkholderia largidicola TaxID=3014751 RepID=A0A7I8C3K8_9BURK|nr:hypothetical protein [Paraburkholderia sp. PGU16]BCF95109.1 hypothetical protein PPGU16_81760 [Paraburkholderia sp. PGU16]